MVSGLASSIRSATESATFDLAGQDASSIKTTVKDAFSQPMSLADMIRITFVVGGGKLSRSKYDDKAMHAVTSTLKQLDYDEDRGASCILECAGCFKTQHDTGKNVFTVVVFPKVADDVVKNKNGKHQTEDEDYEPLVPTNSPGYKLAVCSFQPTFQKLLSTYCPTYFEKKECSRCLEGLLQIELALENKLMVGNPLDAGEQAFYDESSELKEKYAFAQKEAGKHVEDGKLTLDEKHALVEMNKKRIETLMNEKSSASVAEKLKRALARKQQLKSLTDEVLKMNPSYPPSLRHENQITALRKKLLPLQALEGVSRGRLLTLGETRSLTEKEEIEIQIERLESASCGWFEDEELFEDRLQESRDKFDAKFARSKRSGGKTTERAAGKGGGGNSNAVNKWILPGEKPKNAWGASSSSKGKRKVKGGAVFTAMMMDSSSEEEESESEEESEVVVAKSSTSPKKKQHLLLSEKAAELVKKNSNAPVPTTNTKEQPAETGSAPKAKKKNKKKKKGTKGSGKKGREEDIEEIEETTESTSTAVSSKNDAPSSVSESLFAFWLSFLLPFIMFIISLIVSLVTSMFAGKSKKGGKEKRR